MIKLKSLIENTNTNPIIYCDMDGVICDLFGEIERIMGKSMAEIRKNKNTFSKIWYKVDKIGTKFWSNMPWTPGGKELWNYIKNYNVKILTAVPYSSDSKESAKIARKGKIEWIRKNIKFTPYEIVYHPKDKTKSTCKNCILIDDTPKNIEEWNDAGGIGIHYINTSDTIRKLKQILGK